MSIYLDGQSGEDDNPHQVVMDQDISLSLLPVVKGQSIYSVRYLYRYGTYKTQLWTHCIHHTMKASLGSDRSCIQTVNAVYWFSVDSPSGHAVIPLDI